MHKYLLIYILLSVPFFTFSNTYEEAIKLDAKGQYEEAYNKFREYFNNNINQNNQDSITQKLFYASTLLGDASQSLDFLKSYVKFMKNPNSRFRVYKRIAQIHELKGEILLAGKYYEKSAYTPQGVIDYNSLFDSLGMFIEIGYFKETVKKLDKIDTLRLKRVERSSFNYIYSLALFRLGDIELSKKYLNKIDIHDSRYWYLYSELYRVVKRDSRFIRSVEYDILNNHKRKLKTPSDYIGIKTGIGNITDYGFNRDIEIEFNLGSYKNRNDSAGIVNLVEQIGLSWFMDYDDINYTLYVFSNDRDRTIKQLNALGINFKIEASSESNIR